MGVEGKKGAEQGSFFLWCGVWGSASSWAKKKQPQDLQTYQQSEVTDEKGKPQTPHSVLPHIWTALPRQALREDHLGETKF